MDSFSLYCWATEVRPAELLRALGLIERRLARAPKRIEEQVYRGAILARLSLQLDDPDQRQRVMATGIDLMRRAGPGAGAGQMVRLKMLYAHAITTAALPCPPVLPSEAWQAMVSLLAHPGFPALHPRRRAAAEAAQQNLLAWARPSAAPPA